MNLFSASTIIAGAGDVAAAPGVGSARTAQMAEAAGMSAMVLVGLALFLCGGILAFALFLRHRANNTPPEAILLEQICAEQNAEEAMATSHSDKNGQPEKREPWERPDDWWKSDSDRS